MGGMTAGVAVADVAPLDGALVDGRIVFAGRGGGTGEG